MSELLQNIEHGYAQCMEIGAAVTKSFISATDELKKKGDDSLLLELTCKLENNLFRLQVWHSETKSIFDHIDSIVNDEDAIAFIEDIAFALRNIAQSLERLIDVHEFLNPNEHRSWKPSRLKKHTGKAVADFSTIETEAELISSIVSIILDATDGLSVRLAVLIRKGPFGKSFKKVKEVLRSYQAGELDSTIAPKKTVMFQTSLNSDQDEKTKFEIENSPQTLSLKLQQKGGARRKHVRTIPRGPRRKSSFTSSIASLEIDDEKNISFTVIFEDQTGSFADDFISIKQPSMYRYPEDVLYSHQKRSDAQKKEKERTARLEKLNQLDKMRRAIMEWLPYIQFETDQMQFLSRRTSNTGAWLFKNERYNNWETGRNVVSNVLLVHGNPGCGKSCLAALAISRCTHKAKSSGGKVAVAYVYCSILDSAKANHKRLLASIMHQLCRQVPRRKIPSSLDNLYSQIDKSVQPTEGQLEEGIITLAGGYSKVYLYVDGIDECDRPDSTTFQDLYGSLVKIANAQLSVIRMLVLIRSTHADGVFTSAPRIVVDEEANRADLQKYISNIISTNDSYIRGDSALLDSVTESLTENADGAFLQVKLLVKSLQTAQDEEQIREIMRLPPRGLFEAYDQYLRQVMAGSKNPGIVLHTILWVANSKQPLSREELSDAVEASFGSGLSDGILDKQCGDLIVLKEDRYHLIHASLQDYLTKLDLPESVQVTEYRELQTQSRNILGSSCLRYLLSDYTTYKTIDDLQALQKNRPFYSYAAIKWGYHVQGVEDELWYLIHKFVICEISFDLSMQHLHAAIFEDYKILSENTHSAALHALSYFNLVSSAQHLPGSRQVLYEEGIRGAIPLDYALLGQAREMCSWLLQDDYCPLEPPSTSMGLLWPLHMAVQYDWDDVVTKLLAVGYDGSQKVGSSIAPIHIAASEGSQSALMALLNVITDFDMMDDSKQTPLIKASEAGHEAIAMKLIELGADVRLKDSEGLTALHYAAAGGLYDLVHHLIGFGTDINIMSSPEYSTASPLHFAISEKKAKVVELLISKGGDIGQADDKGYTSILRAAASGDVAITNFLLKLGSDLGATTKTKDTALHLAAINDHLDIVKILLALKQDLVSSSNESGCTPLHNAIDAKSAEIADLLLQNHASVHAEDSKGHTALHRAVHNDMHDLVLKLIEDYKADTMKKAIQGSPPLHYAANAGHSYMIDTLVARGGADPHAVNDNEQNAIHFAATKNHLDFIKKLVQLTPSFDLHAIDKWGQSPLHIAALNGNIETVRFFVEQGVPPIQDINGETPLHFACRNGHKDCVLSLLQENDMEIEDHHSRTPLWNAAANGHMEIVMLLVQKGANIHVIDEYKQTLLNVSLKNKHFSIAEMLLETRELFKEADGWGATPLHITAALGNKELTQRCLEAGCDGLVPDLNGNTPFMNSVLSDKIEVVKTFLDRNINGCAIKNRLGVQVVQIAAANGNEALFQVLLKASEELGIDVTTPDAIGCNALTDAATDGHVKLIEPLLEIGFDLNGPPNTKRTPIIMAAAHGQLGVSESLLAKSCMVESRDFTGSTPLIIAAANQLPYSFQMLLQAGSNLHTRNYLGLSALDYAYRTPTHWNLVDESDKATYTTLAESERIETLYRTVKNAVLALLGIRKDRNPTDEHRRAENLLLLSRALECMQTEGSFADATVCHTELKNPAERQILKVAKECNFCKQKPIRGDSYSCTICEDLNLCVECYEMWTQDDADRLVLPRSVYQLEMVEEQLRRVMLVLENWLKFGAEFIYSTLSRIEDVRNWMETAPEAYVEWTKEHDNESRFRRRPTPGREFLEIMAEVRRMIPMKSIGETRHAPTNAGKDFRGFSRTEHEMPSTLGAEDAKVDSRAASLLNLDAKLKHLFRKYTPSKEPRIYACSGHTMLSVPSVDWSKTQDEYSNFDQRGSIKDEWFSGLLAKYSFSTLVNQLVNWNTEIGLESNYADDVLALATEKISGSSHTETQRGLKQERDDLAQTVSNLERQLRSVPEKSHQRTKEIQVDPKLEPSSALKQTDLDIAKESTATLEISIFEAGVTSSNITRDMVASHMEENLLCLSEEGLPAHYIDPVILRMTLLERSKVTELVNMRRAIRQAIAKRVVKRAQVLSTEMGQEGLTIGADFIMLSLLGSRLPEPDGPPDHVKLVYPTSLEEFGTYCHTLAIQVNIAFEVAQVLLVGCTISDLVPDYDIYSLLVEEGKIDSDTKSGSDIS